MNTHPVKQQKRISWFWTAALCLSMAACSSVKLDKPAQIDTAKVPDAGASSASGADAGSTRVTTVTTDSLGQGSNTSANTGLVRTIYFDYDSYAIKDEFRSAVEAHAKRLTNSPSQKIIIEGHTDERGSSEYNLALGQKRAEAVQKSLTLLGASPQQIESVSYGKDRPAVQGSGEEAWAQNRRAEIKDR